MLKDTKGLMAIGVKGDAGFVDIGMIKANKSANSMESHLCW